MEKITSSEKKMLNAMGVSFPAFEEALKEKEETLKAIKNKKKNY